MRPALVIYHASCADGAGAAWAAFSRLGNEAEYRPAHHGRPAPTDQEVADRTVYVLDFSYPRAEMERMAAAARSLLVLDHHKTAAEDLAGLSYGHFDMNRSGCVLAWEHFMDGAELPLILAYIQDRDLWQWRLERSREVSAALTAVGIQEDFRRLGQLPGLADLQQMGSAILLYQDRLVETLCGNCSEVVLDGYQVLASNTPVLQSEVAGQLARGRPFGVAWFRTAEGQFAISMRAREGSTVDVSAIARRHGGGGHARAAGYTQLACPWTDEPPPSV